MLKIDEARGVLEVEGQEIEFHARQEGDCTQIDYQGDVVRELVNDLADFFVGQGAVNNVEMRLFREDTGHLLLTLQRVEGLTPGEQRDRANREIERLRKALESLVGIIPYQHCRACNLMAETAQAALKEPTHA